MDVILFIVFLILKLTGVIDWSWWWVTAPLWIGFILQLILGPIAFSILGGFWVWNKIKRMRSKKRIAFCIIGAILIYVDTTYAIPVAVLLPRLYLLGLFFAIFGSYIWAKEKGRSGWWCLMGLIAPIGYIVLMKLKDKRVLNEVAAAQEQTTPIILPPPMEQQPTMNFCPECGYKVTEQMAYCPNCGRELKRTRS